MTRSVKPAVSFDDLVGHTFDGPSDLVGVHHLGSGDKVSAIGWRASTFTFAHRAFLLSVWASRDPLHGQTPKLAAVRSSRAYD